MVRVGRRKWFAEFRKKLKYYQGWKPGANVDFQAFVPKDNALGRKLGIGKKQNVVFVLGCYGDWARELSKFCNLKYTDISPEMTNFAKARINNERVKYGVVPAEIIPQRKKVYDWTFSFEPFPLLLGNGPELSFMRTLLNKYGSKFVFAKSKKESKSVNVFFKRLSNFAQIYGCELEQKQVFVEGGKLGQEVSGHNLTLFTLKTNSGARERANLDLKLLNYLNKHGRTSVLDLAKKFGTTSKRVDEAIVRIDAIGKSARDKVVHK